MNKVVILVLFVFFAMVKLEFVPLSRAKDYSNTPNILTLRFKDMSCDEFMKHGISSKIRGARADRCLPLNDQGRALDRIRFGGRCFNVQRNAIVEIMEMRETHKHDGPEPSHHDYKRDIEMTPVQQETIPVKNQVDAPVVQEIKKNVVEEVVVEKKGQPQSQSQSQGLLLEEDYIDPQTPFWIRLSTTGRKAEFKVVNYFTENKGGEVHVARNPFCYKSRNICDNQPNSYVNFCQANVRSNTRQGEVSKETGSVWLQVNANQIPDTCFDTNSCCRYVNGQNDLCRVAHFDAPQEPGYKEPQSQQQQQSNHYDDEEDDEDDITKKIAKKSVIKRDIIPMSAVPVKRDETEDKEDKEEKPETPEKPEKPETPETPETPEKPETPETPKKTEIAEKEEKEEKSETVEKSETPEKEEKEKEEEEEEKEEKAGPEVAKKGEEHQKQQQQNHYEYEEHEKQQHYDDDEEDDDDEEEDNHKHYEYEEKEHKQGQQQKPSHYDYEEHEHNDNYRPKPKPSNYEYEEHEHDDNYRPKQQQHQHQKEEEDDDDEDKKRSVSGFMKLKSVKSNKGFMKLKNVENKFMNLRTVNNQFMNLRTVNNQFMKLRTVSK